MSFLNLDSNLKTFESGTFEGVSQLDLLGQILIELRVHSTYLQIIAGVAEEPQQLRNDEFTNITRQE